MSAHWVERASHLIEQSRKTAANVVLGVGIAVAIALFGQEAWPAFIKLPTALREYPSTPYRFPEFLEERAQGTTAGPAVWKTLR